MESAIKLINQIIETPSLYPASAVDLAHKAAEELPGGIYETIDAMETNIERLRRVKHSLERWGK